MSEYELKQSDVWRDYSALLANETNALRFVKGIVTCFTRQLAFEVITTVFSGIMGLTGKK